MKRPRAVGDQSRAELNSVSREFGLGEVRGNGLLLALELNSDLAAQIVANARANGLLLNAPRPHCLRFMPALTTTPAEVEDGIAILRQTISAILAGG